MQNNPILTAANAPLTCTNYQGTGVLEPTATISGVPLGTDNGTATGVLGVKVLIVGGSISVGAVDAEAKATAAAPSYTENTDNILSQTLTGDLRTIAKIASGQTIALSAGAAIVGNFRIDQTTPGTTNGVVVTTALPAGANIIGNVRIDQTTPGTTNAVQLSGSQLTPVSSTETDASNSPITAGKKQIDMFFSSDFAGTVNGQSYNSLAGGGYSFIAPPGYTFAAIAYTISAGSILIVRW